MILLSELSRRRIRSIQKLIRVGRNEVVVVLRVDKEKGKHQHHTIRCPPPNRKLISTPVCSFCIHRLHRPVEAPRVAGRYHEMRGALHEGAHRRVDHASCCLSAAHL